jgi:type IV secretory pathway VirB2 component (pilin)
MPQLANMPQLTTRRLAHLARLALAAALLAIISAPDLALAQTSPFMTGASALQTNILAWLTPVAIILVMVLGGMAMANRMLRLFARRRQRDLRPVQAAAGVAQGRRCTLHDQVCGARTSADGATRFARGLLPP